MFIPAQVLGHRSKLPLVEIGFPLLCHSKAPLRALLGYPDSRIFTNEERSQARERRKRRRHPCQDISADPFADQGCSLPPPGPQASPLRSGVVVTLKNPKIRALTQRRLWATPLHVLGRLVSQFLGLGEVGVGFGFVVFLPVRITPSIEYVPIFRIDPNRRCKVRDRFVVVTLLAVAQPRLEYASAYFGLSRMASV